MLNRPRRQSLLLDRYWAALRRDRRATPPDDLDREIAALADRLAEDVDRLEPSSAFRAVLRQRVEARIATKPTGDQTGWARPALDVRRATSSPSRPATDTEEDTTMAEITETPGEYPVDIQQRRRLREWAGLAAAAFAIIVVGIVLALAFHDDDGGEQIVAPGPAATPTATPSPAATETPAVTSTSAPATPSPTATVPSAGSIVERIPVGAGPGGMVTGAGSIWVVNSLDGTVSRIDPATSQVVATIPIGSPGTDELFIFIRASGDRIWVLNHVDETLLRIDPATNQVVETLPRPDIPGVGTLRSGTFAVAIDGALWIAYEFDGWIARFDPLTGEITATIEVDEPDVATGSDAVWVISERTLLRLDPATAEVVATIELDDDPRRLAVTDDAVWVGLWGPGGRVLRIDPDINQVVASIDLGMAADLGIRSTFEMTAGETGVWMVDFRAGQLYRIDPATNQLTGTMPVGIGFGIVESEGSVWVSFLQQYAVQRIAPSR